MKPGSGRGPLIGGILLIALLAALITYAFGVRPYHDLRIALSFVESSCRVIGKGFEEGATRRFAHPAINVVYPVDGGVTRSRGFDDRGSIKLTQSTWRSTAQDMLAQFAVGATYPCWYDPAQPRRVVLVRGKSFLLALAFAWIIGLLALVVVLNSRPVAKAIVGAIGLDVFAVLIGYGFVEDAMRGWPNYLALGLLALLATIALALTAWAAWVALRALGRW